MCAHALKCSVLWKREVSVCPRPWAAGEEILPRKRKAEKKQCNWAGPQDLAERG